MNVTKTAVVPQLLSESAGRVSQMCRVVPMSLQRCIITNYTRLEAVNGAREMPAVQ